MVRTFLVAVRASTAIAVQICANLLSVGLSCVRALVKLPKSRHAVVAAASDSFKLLQSKPILCTSISFCPTKNAAELAVCKDTSKRDL